MGKFIPKLTSESFKAFSHIKTAIVDDQSTLFKILLSFFTDPVGSTKKVYFTMRSFTIDDFLRMPEDTLVFAKDYLNTNNITITNIALSFFLFIIGYVVCKHLSSIWFAKNDYKFFGKQISRFFIGIWAVLAIFALDPADVKSIFSAETCITLPHIKTLVYGLGATVVLSVLFVTVIVYLSETFVVVPCVVGICSFLYCVIYNYTISKEAVVSSAITFFVCLILSVIIKKCLKKYIVNIKKSYYLLMKNTLPMLFFILIFCIPHYFMIRSTVSLSKGYDKNSTAFFFLILMNAWAHFTTSYFINVFTSSYLNSSYSNLPCWKRALSVSYNSFNYICNCSLFCSIFQTVLSVVEAVYVMINNKPTNVLWKAVSLILYLVLWVLRLFITLVDLDNLDELTKLGILGIEEYAKQEDKSLPINENVIFNWIDGVISSIETAPHILVSFASLTLFNAHFYNIGSVWISFSFFLSASFVVYFIKALSISHKVIVVNEKLNTEKKLNASSGQSVANIEKDRQSN